MSLYTKLQTSCPTNSSMDPSAIGAKFWTQVRCRVSYCMCYPEGMWIGMFQAGRSLTIVC